MEAGAPGWAASLEASPFAVWLKQSEFLFPFVNVGHVLGIALLVGAIVALDLRLLGFARGLSVAAAERFLRGLALAGLIVAAPTGILMFIADAAPLSTNATFLLKIGLVTAGLVNAVLFVWLWRKRMIAWDSGPPVLGRVQAALSLGLWLGAATAGRLIAYF